MTIEGVVIGRDSTYDQQCTFLKECGVDYEQWIEDPTIEKTPTDLREEVRSGDALLYRDQDKIIRFALSARVLLLFREGCYLEIGRSHHDRPIVSRTKPFTYSETRKYRNVMNTDRSNLMLENSFGTVIRGGKQEMNIKIDRSQIELLTKNEAQVDFHRSTVFHPKIWSLISYQAFRVRLEESPLPFEVTCYRDKNTKVYIKYFPQLPPEVIQWIKDCSISYPYPPVYDNLFDYILR